VAEDRRRLWFVEELRPDRVHRGAWRRAQHRVSPAEGRLLQLRARGGYRPRRDRRHHLPAARRAGRDCHDPGRRLLGRLRFRRTESARWVYPNGTRQEQAGLLA